MSKKSDYPEELPALLKAKIANAEGSYNTQLSQERLDVLRYLNREEPKRARLGNSAFVSTDVLDAVEGMRAQLVAAFSNGQDIVRFKATKGESTEAARIATAYTKWVVFEDNDGFNVLQDCIFDALVARVGIVKVWWEESEKESEESFENLDPMTFHGLAAQPDVKGTSAKTDEDGYLHSGTLTRTKNTSRVRIMNIAPEEFYIESGAKSLKTAFHAHVTPLTKAEIADMGFDVSELKNIGPDGNHVENNEEELVRQERLNGAAGINDDEMREEDMKYRFWECYVHLVIDGKKGLYKVVRVADQILDFEEVARSPFVEFVPIRRSHMFEGDNFAAWAIQTQNANTLMYRAWLDHTAQTASPRWLVNTRSVKNPNELKNNLPNGLITVDDLKNAVAPMPMPNMNPNVMALTQELTSRNERTTGLSALNQGLNTDVLSNQNSTAMVAQQIGLGMMRPEVMAQNFARNFLRPLFIEVYTLVIENDENVQENSQQIAGNFVPVDPKTWIARKDTEITMHLSPGARDMEAQKLLAFAATVAQSPAAAMIQPQNAFAILSDVARLSGFDNPAYLTSPDKLPPPQPPQPDPIQMGMLQVEQGKLEVEKMRAQMDAQKQQHDFELKQLELQLKMKQVDATITLKQGDAARKTVEVANDVDVMQRETTILENTPMTQGTAMAAPKPFAV